MCSALINYFVNDDALPDKFKTLTKEIDNFYYDLDEEILCRIMTAETNRNQTSKIPVLPQNLIVPAFEYFHSDIGGHLGVTKTFHKLKQYFYVPSAITKLKEFVSTCEACNLRKIPQAYPNPPMGRVPVAKYPFDIISFDLYETSGALPVSSRGHTCILSVIDHF